MLENIPQFCADAAPVLLGLFDLSIAPQLLFYAYIPIILIALLFSFFIYRQERKSLQGILLLAVTGSFVLWVMNIFIQWVAVPNWLILGSWQATALFEISIFLSSIYLTYVFIQKGKNISWGIKSILAGIMVAVIVLLPTQYNISSYDAENCEGVVGTLWLFIYSFEIISILWVIFITRLGYKSSEDKNTKNQILIFGIGMVAFLTFFSFSNIFAEIIKVYEINLVGPLGLIVFLGSLAYIIVKYNAFHVKLISTQVLVYALWLLVFSLLFIDNISLVHLVVAITFLILLGVGVSLIKSVKKEVQQKEMLEKITDELEAANFKLQDLDKMKTEFLSLASHQLRSPLTAIKGYASMLLEGSYGQVKEEQKVPVDRIFQSSVNLAQIVEDLLDVSKIEQGGMKFEMSDVDLVSLLKGLSNELQVSAKSRNLELTLSTKLSDAVVVADPVKIRQVFANYVDNALKYTQKGSVTISLEKSPDTKKVIVGVKDSGMGIPPEVMKTLFKKFERGEGGKVNAGGSGLGLYLAKEIVTAHKGRTWAESEGHEKGSTFFVELNLK